MGKWMELEMSKLSEINQNQKDKYHVFFRMWNLNKRKNKGRKRHESKSETTGEGNQEEWGGLSEGKTGRIQSKYIICLYDSATMKPIIVLHN
jgi:hypothetical protein